jgi:hypothetical protein
MRRLAAINTVKRLVPTGFSRHARARRPNSARRALILATIGACLAPNSLRAQTSAGGIRKIESNHVSSDAPKTPHVESHLAINPRNPKHMLAAASMLRSNTRLGIGGGVYVTFDGGKHWQASKFNAPLLYSASDGIVYFNEGTAYFAAIGYDSNDACVTFISRSSDGGRSWPKPTVLPCRDRPWIAFDTASPYRGSFAGRAYMVGQMGGLYISTSLDGGRTWTPGDYITRDDAGGDPTLELNSIYVGGIAIGAKDEVMVAFETPDKVIAATIDGKDSITERQVNLLVSDEAGRTWLPLRRGLVTHDLGYPHPMMTSPLAPIKVDLTNGPRRGRVYITYSDFDRDLNRYVVRVSHSDDLGVTWKTVTPSDTSMTGAPSNISIEVNKDGVVGLIWYDRRHDPKERCWRLYGTISTDGGDTFRPNTALSSGLSCSNAAGNWDVSAWGTYDTFSDPKSPSVGFSLTSFVPVRFPNGGDAAGFQADRKGVFHVAWISGERGVAQIWHTSFMVEPEVMAQMRLPAISDSSRVKSAPPGMTNLSNVLRLNPGKPTIDFNKGTLVVPIRISNPSEDRISGPIQLELREIATRYSMAMSLGNLRVANAENGKDSVGAIWTFNGSMPAHGKSETRVLRFTFEGGRPEMPLGYFDPRFWIWGKR